MLPVLNDNYFMKLALQEAEKAYSQDEVPVGAVIAYQNQVIAKAYNQTQMLNDVTAHAEMIAITSASSYIDGKYLDQCTLYVTLEPCLMCAGAIAWSQLGRLVYAASDDKKGFMRYGKEVLHPRTRIAFGEMQTESEALLKKFFKEKRRSR